MKYDFMKLAQKSYDKGLTSPNLSITNNATL